MMHMKNETIVFGGGCFWCTEAVFKMIKGVTDTTPGYAGGTTATRHTSRSAPETPAMQKFLGSNTIPARYAEQAPRGLCLHA